MSSPTSIRQWGCLAGGTDLGNSSLTPPFKIPQHFNAVHAVTDTKGKVATPEKEVEKPSQSSRGDPERSEGPHSGKINDQHRDASHCINTEVRNLYVGCEGGNLTHGSRSRTWQRNSPHPTWPT